MMVIRRVWRGAGKTHLLIGLGTAAPEQGYRVQYTLATQACVNNEPNAEGQTENPKGNTPRRCRATGTSSQRRQGFVTHHATTPRQLG